MKVEVKNNCACVDRKYPWLGIDTDDNQIVMFTRNNYGITISKGESSSDIDETQTWNEDGFKEFKGEVILKNGSNE